MSTLVETFFDAWGMDDDAARAAAIAGVYASEGTYADPRSQDTLTGSEAIAGYVNMFSANAPGWTAAQAADPDFISTYARDNPTREDVAETFLPYLALRYRPDRISRSLAATKGNQLRAAEMLGLNRNTLRKKIRELDIPVVRGLK